MIPSNIPFEEANLHLSREKLRSTCGVKTSYSFNTSAINITPHVLFTWTHFSIQVSFGYQKDDHREDRSEQEISPCTASPHQGWLGWAALAVYFANFQAERWNLIIHTKQQTLEAILLKVARHWKCTAFSECNTTPANIKGTNSFKKENSSVLHNVSG